MVVVMMMMVVVFVLCLGGPAHGIHPSLYFQLHIIL